jgi:hypothetical protein
VHDALISSLVLTKDPLHHGWNRVVNDTFECSMAIHMITRDNGIQTCSLVDDIAKESSSLIAMMSHFPTAKGRLRAWRLRLPAHCLVTATTIMSFFIRQAYSYSRPCPRRTYP